MKIITIPLIEGLQQENNSVVWFQTTQTLRAVYILNGFPFWYEPITDDQVQLVARSSLGDIALKTPCDEHITGRPPMNTTFSQEYANGIHTPIQFVNEARPALLGIIQYFIFPQSDLPNAENFFAPLPEKNHYIEVSSKTVALCHTFLALAEIFGGR